MALRHRIIDIPNDRSSHTVPTARGGGLAIVLTWYLGISIFFYFDYINQHLYYALLSGLFLAGVSIVDDIISLKPNIRLCIQILTAILAFLFLKGINPVIISGLTISSNLFLFPCAIIGIMWFTNLFNFLDGIDGYASLEAIIISLVMYLITSNYICLLLISAVAGFLFWNWPKAKIFMGDIGSTQLGFILVVLGIYFQNESELSIVHWLMISSLFWFDATLTLFRRWKNNEKVTYAHKKHAYQRAVQSGLSHQRTITYSVLINLFIIVLVLLSRLYDFLTIPLFILNLTFLFIITKLIDRRIPFKA